jgi:DNA-binding protein HU-beta
MNKQGIVKEIANRTELSQKNILTVIDALQDVIKDTVVSGEKVSLSGFVSFDKKHVDAKSGVTRIGDTEREWTTEPKDVVTVKLSKVFKEI